MDLTGLVSWIFIGVFLTIILWVQRRTVRTQLAAQREVLDRYKESLAKFDLNLLCGVKCVDEMENSVADIYLLPISHYM
jgi:hypothetical protein